MKVVFRTGRNVFFGGIPVTGCELGETIYEVTHISDLDVSAAVSVLHVYEDPAPDPKRVENTVPLFKLPNLDDHH